MATIEQLSTALKNADKAGDVQAAKILANEIIKMKGAAQQAAPSPADIPQADIQTAQPPAFTRLSADRATETLSPDVVEQQRREAMNQRALVARTNRGRQQRQQDYIEPQYGADDIIKQNTAMGRQEAFEQKPWYEKLPVAIDDTSRTMLDGVTFGFGDKAAAGLGAAFTDQTYAERLKAERDMTQAARERSGSAGLASEVAGSVMTGSALAKGGVTLAGRGSGILSRMGLMGTEGAAYGGINAAGHNEDIATGAAMGGIIGGGIPAIAAGVKALANPITQAVKARINPGSFADAKITERLADAGMTIEQAAKKVEGGNGLALADVGGKSTQSLLRTTTNIPGKAQNYVTTRLNTRQLAQGDRVKTIIRETFADPEKFEMAKTKLFQMQAETSAPLYEKALSKKNFWNDRLQQFLVDPIMKRGIAQGVKIQRLEALAENKPFNPNDFAIVNFDEAGDPIIGGVPNMRTINVIKKGLDAMLEGARHPITGRLTEEGRAVDQARRAFLTEVDKINPDYALARKNYASYMQVNEAMEFGKEVFSMAPAMVSAKLASMSPMEKIAARTGAAEAMRKSVDEVGWNNNTILKLFNSRQKVKNLELMFNSKEEFAAARKMVFDEMRKRSTYEAVKGNSTTARQLADMKEAGGLSDSFKLAATTATGGVVPATLQWVGSRLKMLGGLTPQVADDISKKLLTSDPQKIKSIVNELSRLQTSKISGEAKQRAIQDLLRVSSITGVAAENRQ